MKPPFPAVFLGGPPHSGKSTLTYRLSQALRRPGVPHYALRASPDGDGDWLNEAPMAQVVQLRMRAKSDWTPAFAERVGRDIERRHLPLLVDAGGRVSPETEHIAAHCTHALLLAADPAALAPWRELVGQQGLALVAELRSVLDGPQSIEQAEPLLRGSISGLSRHRLSDGVCFHALVERLQDLFSFDAERLYRAHLEMTDSDLVINVERAIYPLPARTGAGWDPADLPTLLESLPAGVPLGIYGRGPVWLYAALAASNVPHPCVLFDARLGWVAPPVLHIGASAGDNLVSWECIVPHAATTHVRCAIRSGYLEHQAARGLVVPPVAPDRGVVLDGKLPNWLWAALARTYCAVVPWVGVFHPQSGQAVVVWSRRSDVAVGSFWILDA